MTESRAEAIRILIADDHPVFRFGLKTLIGAEKDIEVVGEATTGDQVVELSRELKPDLILMDLNMPGKGGIEATREILHIHPDIRILVITMFDDDSVFAAMRAGAQGYLLKGAGGDETVRAIRAVSNGDVIFSPTVGRRLINFFAKPHPVVAPRLIPDLTERELEILNLIARGYSNSRIAHELVLSPKTVSNHISSIFGKLQVADRAQAIVRAREAGLG